MMTQEQLELNRVAMEEQRRYGQVSKETADKIAELGSTYKKAEKAVTTFSNATLTTAKDIGSWGSALAKGQGSFESLSSTITAVTSVVGKLASALPLVGGAAKALAEGVGEAGKFVLDQLDTMSKSYQAMGDISAGAADGLSGLQRQFNQIGLTSLPAFTKALGKDTQGIAAFGAGMTRGAEEFSKITGALTSGNTAQEFLKLGMNIDQVAESGAKYVTSFSRLGLIQKQSTDQTAVSAKNYITQIDLLARITGETRSQQEAEQQKSLQAAQFRSNLSQMEAEGQGKAAKELNNFVNASGGYAEALRGFTRSGVPQSEEAMKLYSMTAGQASEVFKKVASGALGAEEGILALKTAGADATKSWNAANAEGANFADIFGQKNLIQGLDDLAYINKVREIQEKDGIGVIEASKKAQEALKSSTDKSTDSFTNAQISILGTSKDLQKLGFSISIYAVPAVDLFAEQLKKVTSFMEKTFSPEGDIVTDTKSMWDKVKSWFGGSKTSDWDQQKSSNTGLTGAAAKNSSDWDSSPDAVAPSSGRPSEQLKFSGESGSESSFSKLDPQLQKQLLIAGKNYEKTTGGKLLTITSAFRDHDKQQELYDQYVARGKQGTPVAPPGKSAHEFGGAVDVQEGRSGDTRAISALNNAGLYQNVSKDPVHFQSAGTPGFATGGIARGPSTGYSATLHNTEAIIPLPAGGKIPVEITSVWPEMMGGDASILLADRTDKLTQQLIKMENQGTTPAYSSSGDNTSILSAQLEKLDEIVRVMSNQLSISNRILQYQQ